MIALEEIEEVLMEFEATERHEVEYAIQFFLPLLKQYVYINKRAGGKPSGLIIHPRAELYKNELALLDGIETTGFLNHKSSMRKFPKRLHRGEQPIPFGIPFGFQTKESMRLFLNHLSEVKPLYLRNPEDEITNAKVNGEFDKIPETEVESLVSSRRGQGKYRKSLIELWQRCSVTGCEQVELLKASHIKPWRDSSNEERLDPYNGLLLTPNLDTLFDSGMISFDRNGEVLISESLDSSVLSAMNVEPSLKLRSLSEETAKYLNYHRKFIYQAK